MKQQWISKLRIYATFAVVLLHTASTLSENSDLFNLTTEQEVFFQCIHKLLMWAVPLFFMITGILLLDNKKEIDIKKSLLYARRAMLALIVFGIPFAFLKLIGEAKENIFMLIPKSLLCVLENKSFSHLWYLYALIGIYLILPFLKKIVNQCEKYHLLYLLCILFVFDFIFPLIENIISINIAFSIPISYMVFYLLLGYYINQYIDIKSSFVPCIILLILSIFTVIATATFDFGDKFSLFSYNSPLTVIFSSAILMIGRINRNKKDLKFLWKIDRLCFGVYLIHPLFIQVSYRKLDLTPVLFQCYPLLIVVFFLLFLVLSFVASWLMSLIPPLKKYIL